MAAFSEESISAATRAAISDSMSLVGVEELKKEQSQAIRSFVSGRDVFVALPTGYGKSYCYTLLPLVFDRLRATTHKSIVICGTGVSLPLQQNILGVSCQTVKSTQH